MDTSLALFNSFIYVLLSGLHLFWMFGGKWGLAYTVPSHETSGKPIFEIGKSACMGVALGMLSFAFYHISMSIGFKQGVTSGATKWVIWVIAAIFLLRAIGDFRYVGFFKKVQNTKFYRMDTKWFTPLCLYLGLSSLYLGVKLNF